MPEEPTPLQEAREAVSRFKTLLDDSGWQWLFTQAQADVQGILNGIVSTPRAEITQDTVYSWVFQLGEMAGILKHFDKPQHVLNAAQEEYDQLKDKLRKDDDERESGNREPGDTSP